MGQNSRRRNEQRKNKAAIDNMPIERLEGLGDAIDLMHLAFVEDENGISNLMRCIRYIVMHHNLAEVVVMRREIANMGASRYVAGLAAEIGREGAICTMLAITQVAQCGPELYARMNPVGIEIPF